MKIEIKRKGENGVLIVKRENDKKVYSESYLMHLIKKELIKQGFDVIKKRIAKDKAFTHLWGDNTTQYIRTRGKKKDVDSFYVYDPNYQIRLLFEDYNKGECFLYIQYNIFN